MKLTFYKKVFSLMIQTVIITSLVFYCSQSAFAAVTQQIGFYDTLYNNLNNNDCKTCHGELLSDRHHATYEAVNSNCGYCHMDAVGQMEVNRDCTNCHYQSDHHTSAIAANLNCYVCHSPDIVASVVYDPGAYNPTSEVFVDQCRNCHVGDTGATPGINETRDLHHGLSMTCQTCHYDDLTTSIKKCEQCHQPESLHQIHPTQCGQCHGSSPVGTLPPAPLLPVIDSVYTNSGLVGDVRQILGSDFGDVTGTVKVGIITASVVSWNDQLIEFVVPNMAPGNYDISVVNSNGTGNMKVFTVLTPLDTSSGDQYGMPDVYYEQLTETDCRSCHYGTVPLHHSIPESQDCTLCHQGTGTQIVVERNCKVCHTSSPHHSTGMAQSMTCTACHSSQVVNEYKAIALPVTAVNNQTPTTDNCATCHPLPDLGDRHHVVGLSCFTCHQTSDMKAIRTCEDCHSAQTLHGIGAHFKPEQCEGCHTAQPTQFPELPQGVPEITGISVNSGGAGSTVTIDGNNFGEAIDKGKVYLDVYTAPVLDWTNNQIIVRIPDITAGNYSLFAENPAGTSNSLMFTVTSPGAVEGKVTDLGGQPVSEAKISIGTMQTFSDAQGNYVINGLGEGIYSAQVSRNGYLSQTQLVNVLSTITTTCDFQLISQLNPPGNLTATSVTSHSVSLSWTTASGSTGIAGYEIFRDGVKIGQSADTFYADGTVSASGNYSYQIRAFNSAGTFSSLSNPLVVQTPAEVDTQAPSVVDSLSVTGITSGSSRYTKNVAFKWNASTDNNGIKGYEIWRNGTKISFTANLTYTDKDVRTDTTYDYTVLAVDLSGNYSAPGNHICFRLSNYRNYSLADMQSPSTPQGLTGTLYDSNHIKVSWKAASDNTRVYGYEIWLDGTRIARTSSLSYTTESLQGGKEYGLYVVAYDSVGNKSAASNIVKLLVPYD